MSYQDPPNANFPDDSSLPFIDNEIDKFEPESTAPSLPRQDLSYIKSEPLGSVSHPQRIVFSNGTCSASAESFSYEVDPQPVEGISATVNMHTNTSTSKETQQPKRGIQDFLSSFLIDENSPPQPRKRQAFSSKRAKEVALVRKSRACQRCRMRKLSVSGLRCRKITAKNLAVRRKWNL